MTEATEGRKEGIKEGKNEVRNDFLPRWQEGRGTERERASPWNRFLLSPDAQLSRSVSQSNGGSEERDPRWR